VFELDQFTDGRSGELGQTGGIEFLARDGQYQVTGVNECGEEDHGPFRLQAECLRRKILDIVIVLNQFGAVNDLSMSLFLSNSEDVPGILGPVWIDAFVVEEFQRI